MIDKIYIITSARFEECYIEEWVQYHLNIGFDKIIINDNNPKDYPYDLKDILKTYIEDGKVIIEKYYDNHDIPDKMESSDSDIPNIYTWLYNKYKDEFNWVAKLDVDEFLEIPETKNNVKEFLNQNKFDNALSIILPFKLFYVKDEYSMSYTRLKNNRDRFEYHKCETFTTWSFKSIIKNSDFVVQIGLHYAYFSLAYNNDDNIILYMLPNGERPEVIELNILNYEEDSNVNNHNDYITNLYNVCCINHYFWRSAEEMVNHCIKFNADKYQNWHLYDRYKTLYEQYPEFFNNPRDLYKIYFLENDNTI